MSDTSTVQGKYPDHIRPMSGNTGEINLLEYVYALVKKRWLILGATLIGIIGGYIAARMKGPVWVAEVVITPKETETKSTPNFSSFGAFSGIVASQLNISGNASLEKIELLLNSRDFNSRLITKYNLLPDLYRYQWPKAYAVEWDLSTNKWKKSFKQPDPQGMGEFLRDTFLKKEINNNLMTIKIHSHDSAMSWKIADYYLRFLDEDIKSSVRKDAKENVAFLEHQLVSIGDPLLREKIQTLMAEEIEKTMLVSKEAFKVLDPIYLSYRFSEKKRYPLAFGTGLFFFSIVIVLLIHAFSSGEKSEVDRQLIAGIRKELFFRKK